MIAVREALETLGHTPGALPEPHLLAGLFVRFQAQVPLRPSPDGLGEEELLLAWLERGEGFCGEARVRTFEALAAAAGFTVKRALARGPDGGCRPVLLALEGRALLDPAFPLPAPLSLDPPAEAEATGYGTLSVRSAEGGAVEILLETRGDERVLSRIEDGPLQNPCDEEAPSRDGTPGRGTAAAADEGLFRLLDDRVLRWKGGLLEISDSWSRLRVPFPATDTDGLEALFGPPIPLPAEPGHAAPEGKTVFAEPTLAVYHASAAPTAHLLGLLTDPAVQASLLPDGWSATGLALRQDGFDRTLIAGGELLRTERVTRLPDGLTLEAEGPLAFFRTRTWRLEARPAGTRLRLMATLRDPVPPRGLPEGTRRRLVFDLASELLALDARAAAG